MRKEIKLLGTGIEILIVIAILAVPAASAQNVIYFVPQNGTIPGGPSNNITVQLRANLSTDSPINTWQTNISFDPACVNITNVTFPVGEGWWSTAPSTGWWSHGEIKIMNARFNCTDNGSDILLANLTIHCEAWGCTSPLNFTGIVNVTRYIECTEYPPQMYHAVWINGTVENEAGAPPPVPVPALIPSGIIALIGLLIFFAIRKIRDR